MKNKYPLLLKTSNLPNFLGITVDILECYLDFRLNSRSSYISSPQYEIIISSPLFTEFSSTFFSCNCVVYYNDKKEICNLTFYYNT